MKIFRRTGEILGAQLQVLQIVGAPTPEEYLHSNMSDSGFVLQYGPILAVLNTTKTNKRIRIFHTRVKLGYILTAEVTLWSIVTIQLLVACSPLKFCLLKFLIFSTCGYSWELARTLLIWLAFRAIEFVDQPVPKALDIFLCQTSEDKAFFTKGSFLYAKNENTS